MAGLSSGGIFLSYRREDAAPYARLLQFQLRERIPDAHLFMDLDSIEPGLDFAEVIREAVNSCAVLVALIGRQWATLADVEGRRRLDNPDDYVRFEVQAALERGVRVIPVLVDGARPLRQEQLPAELQKLARLNALELSYGRYEYDADRLVNLIQQLLAAVPGTRALHQDPATAVADAPITRPRSVRPGGKAPAETLQREPEPVRNNRARATRILNDAARTAQFIANESERASTLADVARALAATDPDRAARLLAEAERLAQPITDEHAKNIALADIAKALAATDPDRAERIAQTITDENRNASALADIAKALAATDPDRAARLLADAVRIAQTSTEVHLAAYPLGDIAVALAATDPARAERVAQSITSDLWKPFILADVASALAATDPDRAARLLADAERIAQAPTSEPFKDMTFPAIAKALAATDPDRAERIAQSITIDSSKASALSGIAKALAATDPDRAARLLADAERIAQTITSEDSQASALADIARALVATDPDRAERVAQSITSNAPAHWKAGALADIAEALAATDPDRAERVAQSITDDSWKATALVMIVEA